ncbi:hypothetical protein PRIPAC_80787, partial [Pristionchus pacificus]
MPNIARPLEIFTKAAFRSSCVWLDAYTSHTGERPCWQWMWNRAEYRVTDEEGAMTMVDRVRMKNLLSPSIICGDIGKFDMQAKKFYSEQQCLFTKGSDDCRPSLSVCLDEIAKAEPLTGSGIGPPPILVLGGLSGRVDRAMATVHSLVPAQNTKSSSVSAANPSYILDGNNLVCILPKGQHYLALTPRAFLTETCGIIPIVQSETRVTTRGFRWNLDNESLSFGRMISTSNELVNDEVEITTSAPVVLTLELLGTVTSLDEPPT